MCFIVGQTELNDCFFFNICQYISIASAVFSQWGFHGKYGGRPKAAKVMVVVTDGESHDEALWDSVIPECEAKGITRFGIAVSGDPQFTLTMPDSNGTVMKAWWSEV